MFFQGPEDQEDSYWRELGYRASLAAHGLANRQQPDPAAVSLRIKQLIKPSVII